MSELLLELGHSATRPQRSLARLNGAQLADAWVSLHSDLVKLGYAWDIFGEKKSGLGDTWINATRLADAWKDAAFVSMDEAYAHVKRLADNYDQMFRMSGTLDNVYQTLGARISAGIYEDKDWDAYLGLADVMMEWRFENQTHPGGDDRVRLGIPMMDWRFENQSHPGGDDRIRLAQPFPHCLCRRWAQEGQPEVIELSGGFMKKLTGKGGFLRKIGNFAKKALPIAAALVATVVTGGAAAPLLGPAMAFALQKKGKGASTAADAATSVTVMEQAGVAVPPQMQQYAATATEALQQSPEGRQALQTSYQQLREGAEAQDASPGVLKAIDSAMQKDLGGMPTWAWFAIGGGGLLVFGTLIALVAGRDSKE